MVVGIGQEHEQRLNRCSPPEVLEAFQFSIAKYLLRKTARLLPTAGFGTHDNVCHNLLPFIIRKIAYAKRRIAVLPARTSDREEHPLAPGSRANHIYSKPRPHCS